MARLSDDLRDIVGKRVEEMSGWDRVGWREGGWEKRREGDMNG